jgi:hypothetical protein
MTKLTARIGSIWSVPQLGTDARCLVLTDQKIVARDHPEHRVMPLEPYAPRKVQRDQWIIEAEHTSSGRRFVGQLYNIRSIPHTALGVPLALLLDDRIIDRIRDAFVAYSRMGKLDLSWIGRLHRRRAIERWQSISGQLDQALVGRTVSAWRVQAELTAKLWELLEQNWEGAAREDGDDQLLPAEHLISWGGHEATIQLRLLLGQTNRISQPVPFSTSVSIFGQERNGQLREFRSEFPRGQFPAMAVEV